MKRIGILMGMMLFAAISYAQVTELSETLVEPPKFMSDNLEFNTQNDNITPLCNYLMYSIDAKNIYEQGVVVINFTIKHNGALSNFMVQNSVSNSTDQSVIACIKSTSGHWTAGHVNGKPVDMNKEIHVSFVDPEKGSLKDQARNCVFIAIKKFNKATNLQEGYFMNNDRAEKKAARKLNTSLQLLELANKYQPNEPSVVFWEACAYEKLGDNANMNYKLTQFQELISPYYQATLEAVDIVLK